MRNNQPVTNVERALKSGQPTVSKTDLKGNITYVNPAFCEVTGYSESQLIGQPHSIIRHPDVPEQVYDDLWHTVKAGRTWRGVVKNRAANGDFYWVEVFVTPVRERGAISGYQSIRTTPGRQEIAAAEALFRAIKNGTQTFKRTPVKTLLSRFSFAQRTWAAFVGLAALQLATALVATMGWGMGWIWAIAGAGILAALIGGGWWLTRALHGIHKLEFGLQQIDEGNFKFNIQVEETDEFADLINSVSSLALNLRALISDITMAAAKVSTQAQTLNGAVDHMSEQTAMQSQRAMQVSALTEELSVTVSEINDATASTAASANQTCEIVVRDEENMANSLASTNRIVDVVSEARATLNDLNSAVERIGSMTSVIKEIADQTNLLALNAAIEAARAGESGRGFAVVADEVRKLAERTASSTQDITSNVTNIRLVTQVTLMTMESAAEEVERGTASIQASSESLRSVLAAAQTTVQKTEQIADALRQQVRASTDVAVSIEEIASLVDSNSKEAMAVNAAAVDLSKTASWMRELVKHFEHSL